MSEPQTATVAPSPTANTGLPLRKDEVISTGFMLQTLLVLVVLLGGVSLALKWFAKRLPGKWANKLSTKTVKRIHVVESVRLSARTRVTLLELDGYSAAVTETPQGATLQFLPASNHATLPLAGAADQAAPMSTAATADTAIQETHAP